MKTLLAVTVLVGLTHTARASDPVGVYAIVSKVVEGKSGDAPTVQLYGWFSPFDPSTGGYQKAQRGYMYFACPKGDETICADEWADLTKLKSCVAFGSRRDPVTFKYRDNGTVRDAAVAAGTPDVYPIAQGVSEPGDQSSQCIALATASAGQPAPEPGVGNPGTPGVTNPPGGAQDPQLQTRGCSMGGVSSTGGWLALLLVIGALALRSRKAAVVLALLAVAAEAQASDQTGVYGRITSVEYEPTAGDVNTATKVKVGGSFVVANGAIGMGDNYTTPSQGFLYYACPAGMETVCRSEWADIKKAIGATDCATWGSRSQFPTPGLGTVRTAATGTPDTYPIAMGVMRTAINQCTKLGGTLPAPDMAGTPPPADMASGEMLQPKTSGCSSVPGAGPALTGLFGMMALGLALGLRRRS
jgi:MYXO-CTERM domain-containing protein